MAGKKIVHVDSDILVIGGGFGGCGAAYESRYWGRDKNVVIVEKATSNEVAQLHRDFMRSTATWVCAGDKTSQKTTFAIREMT